MFQGFWGKIPWSKKTPFPQCSMCSIFTYIYSQNDPNVCRKAIHWASGFGGIPSLGGEWSRWNLSRFGIRIFFGFHCSSEKKSRPIRGKNISRERLRKTNSWEMKILAFYMFGSKSHFCWSIFPVELYKIKYIIFFRVTSYQPTGFKQVDSLRLRWPRPLSVAPAKAPFSVRGMPLQPSWFWRCALGKHQGGEGLVKDDGPETAGVF